MSFLRYLLLLLILVRNATAQFAQLPDQYRSAADSAYGMITQTWQEQKFPGMAVAVAVNGQLIWSDAVGFSDLEQRVPMWPHSRFRIASISKPLTAAAAAKLYSQTKLDVDASIQEYVPNFPQKRWTITTRQLGAHLGGIRGYRPGEMLSAVPYSTVEDGLDIFSADTLLHEPGTKYLYSSYGWNLISAVIEGAAQEPFLDYMQREIFLPFNMLDTVADHPDSLIVHRVRFYVRTQDGTLLNAPYVDNSYKWAGGGFLSTPIDIVRFGIAHLDTSFFDQNAKELLFTEQQTTAGEPTGYAFGWRVETRSDHLRYFSHSGGAIGGTSLLVIQPDTGVVVVAMVNMSNANLDVVQQIVSLFVDQSQS
ncbi:MAG: beta-lactamase family protein [Rhodothermaceae bacterium]|nr:beta-lactamase family protein [Rhodothermaceae bacterium]MXZ56926.1 beta-lactamase family protein [Rhodothermaceae bacterium]MYB91472.1 beta-lactamase family protein [Rhodothermaceae bacterium]MYD67001.1 beta-lactamase family protein [Rhodothermaceae bacterium]MYG43583.1 beta-lactamase family protein [Rhodothermaceae bacterium]